ncbi:MAG TPA: DUF2127 domain-containing protein [Candidatus Saccharimonadales bacterium]|jgi:uncharacterized membrane protein|nr:DUF2127 domain-containing protein [Candidatus Saccharimonadales bacterium]
MYSRHSEAILEKTYIISILIKIGFGVFESISGLVLLYIKDSTIDHAYRLVDSFQLLGFHLSLHPEAAKAGKLFGALYLMTHGIPKIILGIILLRRKLWAYPVALIALGLFIMYQLYLIITAHSIFMILLTLFDLFIVWLIWHEWQRDKIRFAKKTATQS